MRFRAYVYGADCPRVDFRPAQGVPRGLDGHRDRILVRRGDGVFLEHQAFLVAGRVRSPDLGDLLDLDAVAGDVGAVADDAFHETSFLLLISKRMGHDLMTRLCKNPTVFFALMLSYPAGQVKNGRASPKYRRP